MPEICRFYGIVIKMFWNDHAPPHFHAEYGGDLAVIDIQTFAFIRGSLPPKATALVLEWAALHKTDLMSDWNLAKSLQPLDKVEPLQ